MGFENVCETGLVLGLGFPTAAASEISPAKAADNPRQKTVSTTFEPSLTLGLISGEKVEYATTKLVVDLYRQDSGASSFSNNNNNGSVKREREVASEETETARVVSSRVSDELEDDDDGSNNGRKKLRLTKAQSALLEENFKQHSTLNPKQKQVLARELNLRPRQVEVWFQNRRARTKLKQTEVDCEYLKKCCETLTDENRRLQKELQELKTLKLTQPLYMQLPAATLSICPSCERLGSGAGGVGGAGENSNSKTPSFASNVTHFYNPFPSPSAAC